MIRQVISQVVDKFDSLRARIHRQENYRATFDTPQGREVLKHLCRVGHVFSSTFVAGDPHQTSLNEGKRMLVLSILREVNRDTTNLIKQIEEGLTNEQS